MGAIEFTIKHFSMIASVLGAASYVWLKSVGQVTTARVFTTFSSLMLGIGLSPSLADGSGLAREPIAVLIIVVGVWLLDTLVILASNPEFLKEVIRQRLGVKKDD